MCSSDLATLLTCLAATSAAAQHLDSLRARIVARIAQTPASAVGVYFHDLGNGDTLLVDTVVSNLSAASMTFAHVVKEKASGRVIVEGAARLAATDGNGKVKRLDKAVVAVLQSGAEKESLNG